MSKAKNKRGKSDDMEIGLLEPSPKKLRSAVEEERRASIMSPGKSKLDSMNGLRGGRGGDKPAELFRKDLISAMKLPDSELLRNEDYLLICDPWRQEWERGVQVPVNPTSIPDIRVRICQGNEKLHGLYPFKMPKKFLHATQDDDFKQGIHELHETQKMADQVCRYDLDDMDAIWLSNLNILRENWGDTPIQEWDMEKIMEELEVQCHEQMQVLIKTVDGLGIEYDENVVCDVCRSPDGEDNNEMVFCDKCDICVHQACYGVMKIPEGSWLCRMCSLGIRPQCILCPKSGGAMKSTRSGTKWAHVSCALWIPEVSIGCAEKMEPINKISQIPSSRWALMCSICRERTGACIQCSVKTCKTAFHVTCAFHNNLEMRTILENEEEEIQLKAFCGKHTKKMRSEECGASPRKDREFMGSPCSPSKELTEEEKTELRSHRLQKVGEEFYNCVHIHKVAKALKLPEDVVDFVYEYWKLKRKSQFNKPLLTPKTEEEDLLSKQQEDSLLARMKMFVHLRQDLERVRNLCYMVTKREKMRRRLYRMKEDVFYKQVAVLDGSEALRNFGTREWKSISSAHKLSAETSVYDQYDDILRVANFLNPQTLSQPIEHDLQNIRVRREHHGRSRKDSVAQSDHTGSESPSVSKRDQHNSGAKEKRDSRRCTPDPSLRRQSLRDRDKEKQRTEADKGEKLEKHERIPKCSKLEYLKKINKHRSASLKSERQKGVDEKEKIDTLAKTDKEGKVEKEEKVETQVKLEKQEKGDEQEKLHTVEKDIKLNRIGKECKAERRSERTKSDQQEPSGSSVIAIEDKLPQNEIKPAADDSGDERTGRALRSQRGEPRNGLTRSHRHSAGGVEDPASVQMPVADPARRERRERTQERHSPRSADPAPLVQEQAKLDKDAVAKTEKCSSNTIVELVGQTEHEKDAIKKPKVKNAFQDKRDSLSEKVLAKSRSRSEKSDRNSLGELPSHRAVVERTERPRRRSEINGIRPDSNFVVSQSVKDKVHRRLYEANSRRNGIHTNTKRRMNNMLSPLSVDIKDENQSPVKDRLRSESVKVRETMFATSPRSNLTGYRIPKRSPAKVMDVKSGESTPLKRIPDEEPGTPETRSRRRRIATDLECDASDRLYDTVDGEISIRSSRSTTPDREYSMRTTRTLHRQLNKKLRAEVAMRSNTPSEMSDDHSVMDVDDVDSEYEQGSEADSESSGSLRVTRSRGIENMDTMSVESGASSTSKYSTRSRNMSEHWSRVLNTLHS